MASWATGCGGVGIYIPVRMVVRGGIRQSRCYPALHMLQRSISSSSNGLRQTWQCASSGRGVGGLVVGRQGYQWLG